MATKTQPRRHNGDGSLFLRGRIWWIAYKHPDGARRKESADTDRRTVAERLLRKRIGAGANNLPVIPRVEKLTFNDAAKMVVNDFTAHGKRSLPMVERRLRLHLTPYFGGRRLVGITSDDVTAFIAKRQDDTIVTRKVRDAEPEQRKPVSNAEINRELQILKRIFNLAIKSGKIATKPAIDMLPESPARAGFFERAQYDSVIQHLPADRVVFLRDDAARRQIGTRPLVGTVCAS